MLLRSIRELINCSVNGIPIIHLGAILLFVLGISVAITWFVLDADDGDQTFIVPSTLPAPSETPYEPTKILGSAIELPTLTQIFNTAELTLLEPIRNSYINSRETIIFKWQWQKKIENDQQFYLYLFFKGREIRVEDVVVQEGKDHFVMKVVAVDVVNTPGDYGWQVRLESINSIGAIAESDVWPVTLLVDQLEVTTRFLSSTPTPTPTSSPTPTLTSTNTRRPPTTVRTSTPTPLPLPTFTPVLPAPPPPKPTKLLPSLTPPKPPEASPTPPKPPEASPTPP